MAILTKQTSRILNFYHQTTKHTSDAPETSVENINEKIPFWYHIVVCHIDHSLTLCVQNQQ